ncbi:MAG: 3-oxoacid CoA-transferase subunit B [Burkholderiaceae bacterium]|nr:3-oxoacid CoA-transferase subunit B [Burkholderiaceae bacterium]
MDKVPLSRQAMCDRLAAEFQDGWVVNLGAGLPTLCSNYVFGDRTVFFHSENGVLGVGPRAAPGHEDLHLINAANEYVTLIPGAAIMDHADSFALVRGGRLDATVLGAFEVACNGDFANWKMAGRRGGAIGGAMDLAVGARRVFIAMEHATKHGESRLKLRCDLPVTATGRITLLMTNLGLFAPAGEYYVLKEIAPGFTVDDIRQITAAPVVPAPDLRTVAVRP